MVVGSPADDWRDRSNRLEDDGEGRSRSRDRVEREERPPRPEAGMETGALGVEGEEVVEEMSKEERKRLKKEKKERKRAKKEKRKREREGNAVSSGGEEDDEAAENGHGRKLTVEEELRKKALKAMQAGSS